MHVALLEGHVCRNTCTTIYFFFVSFGKVVPKGTLLLKKSHYALGKTTFLVLTF